MEKRDYVSELTALSQGVGSDPGLRFEFGPSNCGWHLVPDRRLIVGDGKDVSCPAKCRVLVYHEAGHAAITRYQCFKPSNDLAVLLNVLEDCRMESWLAVRFPGVAHSLRELNQEHLQRAVPNLPRMPLSYQFGLGAIHDWCFGSLPDGLHLRAQAALQETVPGRKAYIDQQPPPRHRVGLEMAREYRASAVLPLFTKEDQGGEPSLFEQAVRLLAHVAFTVAQESVWPIYRALLNEDKRQGHNTDQLQRTFSDRAKPLLLTPPEELARSPAQPRAARSRTDAGKVEDIIGRLHMSRRPIPGAARASTSGRVAVLSGYQPGGYDRTRWEVGPLTERLAGELERRLRPVRSTRWRTGYAVGERVNLARAMAFEADPRDYDRLWERRTLPVKIDPAILLLVDLSGSMRDSGKIENAFRGAVLLAETLHSLQVQFAVHGFQDTLIQFKQVPAPLDEAMRRQLAEMPLEVVDTRPAGHNRSRYNDDGPCLRAAAQELLAAPAIDRFLIVISDGIPEGPAGKEKSVVHLREAVQWITSATRLHLIGLGLGAGTDHVQDFYPNSKAAIPVSELPEELASLIDRILTSRP